MKNLSIVELRKLAQEADIKGNWKMNKSQLIHSLIEFENGHQEMSEEEVELYLNSKGVKPEEQDFIDITESEIEEVPERNQKTADLLKGLSEQELVEISIKLGFSEGITNRNLKNKDLIYTISSEYHEDVEDAVLMVTQPEPEPEEDESIPTGSDLVTLKEIAYELKMREGKARRILRTKKINKPGKRWEWNTGSVELEEVINLLKK